MRPIRQTALAIFVALGWAGIACAAGLDARTSAAEVGRGAPFQLVLSGDAATLTAAPDLSPLGADFDILGTAQSRQTRIVNGARSDTLQWTVTLSARALGPATIPALQAGSASSDPIVLTVRDPDEMPVVAVPGAPEITISLAEGNHYVHQEIPLTVRITAGPNVQGADLIMPQSPDFTLTRSGQDRVSRTNTDQGPVTVTERSFMLRPQRDGSLTLPAITLKAVLADPDARSPFANSPFDSLFSGSPFGTGMRDPFAAMFNPGREVTVRAAPVTLDVLPDPTGQNGWFLPAKDVRLSATWQPESPSFKAGEAVTRKIQLLALGASDVQLPDLDMPPADGVRFYLDGTDARTADTANGTAALREFTYSVVPSHGGDITLPEVTLQWFDTEAETLRTARLPAETITVLGPPKSVMPAAPVAEPAPLAASGPEPGRVWLLAVAALLGLAALGGGFVLLRSPRKDRRHAEQTGSRRAALDRAACAAKAQNLADLHAAASDWLSRAARDTGTTPQEIIASDRALAEGWVRLEERLFAPDNRMPAPNFASLAATLRRIDRRLGGRRKKTRPTSALAALYPEGSHA